MTTQTEPGLDAATLAAALARIADAREYATDVADMYGFPVGAAHIEALAAVAEAAVGLADASSSSCRWCGADYIEGYVPGADGSHWECAHSQGCAMGRLDAALAALAGTGAA